MSSGEGVLVRHLCLSGTMWCSVKNACLKEWILHSKFDNHEDSIVNKIKEMYTTT